ncbi:ATP-binding cassette, subfamily B [Sinosporangium album]|uniref:ATP-binding cassette, subfamily B n=1 Tax=Sinosporangium album TaxID=504805 RepID=A0A1G8BZX2_9ACTN|nr:ABC transporter ATP-binding protein [Sinosporangium album]SDH38613.1 ATP-binding cassette, subfamily B [Sinosporangium album]
MRVPNVAPIISIRNVFREFWPHMQGNRRYLAIGIAVAVFAAACEVVAIWLFGRITDQVLAKQDLGAFWAPASLWLGLAVVAGIAAYIGGWLTALAGERFLLRLRDYVYGHMQGLSPDYFENRRLGDLMARLTDDIEAIEELVASGLVRLVTTVISVFFFAAAAFYIRWDLALVTLALVPSFLIASKVFASRFRKAAGRERLSNGTMNSVVEESLSNQALVQSYNRQAAEAVRLHRVGRTWMRAKLSEARLAVAYGPVVQVLETLCLLTIIGVGAWEITQGRLTIGGLIAFAAYLGYLYPTIQQLGQIALTVSEAGAGADRVIEVLSEKPTVADRAGATALGRSRGTVEFAGVGFTYPARSTPTFSDLSFRVGPGEVLACSGPSGSGKSTMAKLLLRFYDPDAGSIMIDGVDLRDMTAASLRENITTLHQESLLFSGTVRENIAYGRSDATLDQVVQAAIVADAHEFIQALPQGYDTPMGQRGRLVSGGQRQRVAIARALLRDSPILILDEPMTGLDPTSAARIMEPLRRLMHGRTTILITHDLALVPVGARTLTFGAPAAEEPALNGHGRPLPQELMPQEAMAEAVHERGSRRCGCADHSHGRSSRHEAEEEATTPLF